MIRQQRPGPVGDEPWRSHHIDAIAHHFFSDQEPASGSGPGLRCRDLAVATPGCGRLAACAAAGLGVAGARYEPDTWGSCVVEDETIPWSAFSFLEGQLGASLPPEAGADLPDGLRARWVPGRGGDGATPKGWLRWRLLGEAAATSLTNWESGCGLPASARAAGPRWAALVWCVTAGGAVAGDALLDRLVQLLRPARVEILIVPDAWGAPPGRRRLPGGHGEAGLPRFPQPPLPTRPGSGTVAACTRVLPPSPLTTGPAGTAVLRQIVRHVCEA